MRQVVIDNCVFLSAIESIHQDHRESLDFLGRAHAAQDAGSLVVREPPVFVLEFFSVSNRAAEKYDKDLYPRFKVTESAKPLSTTIVPFTEEDAHEIMQAVASAYPWQPPVGGKRYPYTNGGDLMYLAVAKKFGCPLVTLDAGLLRYGTDGFHDVVRPSAWT